MHSSSHTMPLSAGAVWRGHQRSGNKSYEVEVRIAGVDEYNGDVCGTLTIKHLLPSLPKVVTFFDGEIIGPHHEFVTDKWGATEEDDHAHWDKFRRDIYLRGSPVVASTSSSEAGFDSVACSTFPSAACSDAGSGSSDEDGDESDNEEEDRIRRNRRRRGSTFSIPPNVVFMRLKERCFINNHEGRDLSEASFDGFYYIALELNPAPSRPQLSLSKPSSSSFLDNTFDITHHLRTQTIPSSSGLSLLSASAPSSSTFIHGSSGLFSDLSLTRTDSYASVVRGVECSAYSGKAEDSLRGGGRGGATENTNMRNLVPPYSPSLEEFPFPFSPPTVSSSLPRFRASLLAENDTFRPRTRSSTVRAASTPRPILSHCMNPNSNTGGMLSTNFYNAKTGYRGPWAHAVMRGFYFTPPPTTTTKGEDEDGSPTSVDLDDVSATYQELELFYVGDGLGALLEENEEEPNRADGQVDEYGIPVVPALSTLPDEIEKIKKDFLRRERYVRAKSSASFTVM